MLEDTINLINSVDSVLYDIGFCLLLIFWL